MERYKIFKNEKDHHGSAEWARQRDISKAGMFSRSGQNIFLGFSGRRKIYAPGQGGILTVAAPRSGKLTTQLVWNVCGKDTFNHSVLLLDPKGEIAAISQNQMWNRKRAIFWNPAALHGLPQHRINPTGHMYKHSPTLISDSQTFARDSLPLSGGSNSKFFEQQAQQTLSAICTQLAETDGVVTLPRLHEVITGIEQPSEAWLGLEYDMLHSPHAFIRRIASTLKKKHDLEKQGASSDGGGTKGIITELYNSVVCLDDPILRESVSPPFDFCYSELCEDSNAAAHVYLMPPNEFLSIWSPVLKSHFTAVMIWKSRAPQARPILLIVDECAQLGRFPLITKAYTYAAGLNIRIWIFLQSLGQLKVIDDQAETIIPASAAFQCYYGVQDFDTAERLSRLIGVETRSYVDEAQREQARHAALKVKREILSGNISGEVIADLMHSKMALNHEQTIKRPLMTPDEILFRLRRNEMIVQADNVPYPILGNREDYYKDPSMTGFYHPNPYHPPRDRIKVPGRLLNRYLKVITEPVPQVFKHFDQYANGTWSYIEEHNPLNSRSR